MEPFYIVVREKGAKEGLFGKKRHKTKEAAVAEAKRLADKHRANTFYVLQCVYATRKKPEPAAPPDLGDPPFWVVAEVRKD